MQTNDNSPAELIRIVHQERIEDDLQFRNLLLGGCDGVFAAFAMVVAQRPEPHSRFSRLWVALPAKDFV